MRVLRGPRGSCHLDHERVGAETAEGGSDGEAEEEDKEEEEEFI